jgi:hypothetical protein
MLVHYERELGGLNVEMEDRINDQCKYYRSDIIRLLNLTVESFEEALLKTESALNALQVPLKFNIRSIYLVSEDGIRSDLKISTMAAYFLTIHLDPSNPLVAKLQLYFASKLDH